MRRNKEYTMVKEQYPPKKDANRMMSYQKKFDKCIGKRKASWRQVRKG